MAGGQGRARRARPGPAGARLLAQTSRYNPQPEKQMSAQALAEKFRV